MASILIIDDDDSFRTTLAELLLGAGHTVTTAADGLEGANLFRASPADLVLVDMMMPHNGLLTIRVLREQFPGLKLIAMTGSGTHRLDYARSLGAKHTLAKPFTAGQLAAAIADTLASTPGAGDAGDSGV